MPKPRLKMGVPGNGGTSGPKPEESRAADDSRACEYTVAQAIKGKWLAARILMISGYVLFALVYFMVCVLIHFIPLACFTPLFTWMLVYFTWRYVSVSYRYEIVSGDWIFTRVLSDRYKRPMFQIKVKDAERIAPYNNRVEQSRIESCRPEKTVMAASSMESPDLYFALFTDQNGKRTVLYFEATRKALQLLSFYNKSATVLSKVRY